MDQEPPKHASSDNAEPATEAPAVAERSKRNIAANCPWCQSIVVVDTSRPQHLQYCHHCGRRLRKLHKKLRFFVPQQSDGPADKAPSLLIMGGLVLAVVLAATITIVMLRRPESTPSGAAIAPVLTANDQVHALATRFLQARTTEEVLPLIRQPELFTEQVKNWSVTHPAWLPMGGEVIRATTKLSGKTMIAEIACRRPNLPPSSLLCVETPQGWRIDWRSISKLGDMSIADFINTKPTAATLLLTVARASDYYNGAYADSNQWACLHCSDDTGENSFYAYTSRQNVALLKSLSHLELPRSRKTADLRRVERSLAIRVHFPAVPAKDGPLQVEIDSVEGDGWFLP